MKSIKSSYCQHGRSSEFICIIGRLPQGASGKTLSSFTDTAQIDSRATEAMTLLIESGNIGDSCGILNPTAQPPMRKRLRYCIACSTSNQ